MKKLLKKAMKDDRDKDKDKDRDRDRDRDAARDLRRRNSSLSSQLLSPIAPRAQSSLSMSQTSQPSPASTASSASVNRHVTHMPSFDEMRTPTKARQLPGQHLNLSDYHSIQSMSFSSSSVNEIPAQPPSVHRSAMIFETSSIASSDMNDSMNQDKDKDKDTTAMGGQDEADNTLTYSDKENVLDETTDQLADLSMSSYSHPMQHRRGSQTSTTTTATNVSFSSHQSEAKRSFPSKNRITSKNRASYILRNSSSISSLALPTSSAPPSSSIQLLVKPEWDSTPLKYGWANKVGDSYDSRLFRLELKGSSLAVHKLPTELSHAKNLIIESSHLPDNASTVQSMMQDDFIKSTSEIGTPTNAAPPASYSPIDDSLIRASDLLPETAGIEGKQSDTPTIPHSDSAIFSDIIDNFETNRSESRSETFRSSINLEPAPRLPIGKSSKRTAAAAAAAAAIEGLQYQSPSCPHPKLEIDLKSGTILDGSLEAICHTVLFFPSDLIAFKLINSLPMIDDLNIAFITFTKYFEFFTNDAILREKSIKLSNLETTVLFSRIQMVVETALDSFKGAFLADDIYNSFVQFMNLINERSSGMIPIDTLNSFTLKLKSTRNSLIKLTAFEIQTIDPIQPINKSHADLISANEFLKMDIDSFVHYIHAIDSHFMKHWNPKDDRSVVFTSHELIESSFKYWRFNPLYFFPQFHTHYLGRLLAFHLFEDNEVKSPLCRAQLLMKWTQIGEMLQKQGDTCAWLGIAIVMCSQPVLRLSETWSHVSNLEISIIRKTWAPCVFEIRKQEMFSTDVKDIDTETDDRARIVASNKIGDLYAKEDSVPFFGEIFTNEQLVKLAEHDALVKNVKSVTAYLDYINWNLKEWESFYENTQNSPDVVLKFPVNDANPSIILADISDEETFNIIKTAILFNASNGPYNLTQIMQLSIACEPPYVGKLAPFHRVTRSPLFLGSYASILFPEVLRHYEIYDQNELIGALGGSNLVNLKELKHRNRNVFLKRVRDLFNEGNDEFRLIDNSIIFKTLECAEGNKDTKLDEGKKSRPSSILFENPDLTPKHFGTMSTKSFDLSEYITSHQAYLKDAIASQTKTPESALQANGHESANNKINIITTAATPDRLVDLLVLTASIFGTHIRLIDIKTYSAKAETEGPVLLGMDDSSFTNTFFATYRMFFTTRQLIDALHKRFDGSKSAALSIAEFIDNKKSSKDDKAEAEFPKWDSQVSADDFTWSRINWKFVAQIQLGVIESTLILITDYFAHFMDDLETKSGFDTFLEMIDICIISEWPKIIKWLEMNASAENVAEVVEIFKSLQSVYKQVRNICIRKSYTPQIEPVEIEFSDELTNIPEIMKLPHSTDIDQIVKFVNKLDVTVNAVVSRIRPNDWINTFEILQLNIADPLAMFNYNYQDATIHKGLIRISNIFDWITTLRDSKLFGSFDEKVADALPSTVRSALKLYYRLQKYIMLQVIDTKINIDERIDVMCTLLKIIKVCRLRMKNVKLFDEDDEDKSPFIPSFIESVVVNTILSPQSRFFSYAWKQAVSVWKPEQVDDIYLSNLENLLPEFNEYEISAVIDNTMLSICPGWIINRLVEIACFVPNMDVEDTTLINFDKNRFIHNCVLKVHNLQKKPAAESLSPYLTDFSFLFELSDSLPSMKSIYHFSSEEVRQEKLSRCSIFDKHVQDQIQLLKLEGQKRTLLQRQSENQSKSHFRSVNDIEPISEEGILTSNANANNAESSSISGNGDILQASTKHPLKRTTTGSSIVSTHSSSHNKFKFGFFKSRPFSINISQQSSERRSVTLDELPDAETVPSKHKPYLTITLKDVSVFPTYRTPNSFTIDMNSNHTEYTFQTADEQEVEDWIYKITYAKKHWFYSKSLNKQYFSSNVKLTFGAPLSFVCERDNTPIPVIIEKILSEIEFRGLEEVGIYRKSGSHSVVQQIKDVVNKVGDFNMENALVFDVHNLTGLVKAYLRDLPESLIPDEVVDEIVSIREIAKDDSRFGVYKSILSKLPIHNYNLIERLTRHMTLIEEYKSQNKMTSYNLATIMGGSMVEYGRPETMKKTFGLMNFVCEDWILHYNSVF